VETYGQICPVSLDQISQLHQ